MTMLDAQGKVKPLVERLRQACQEGREILGHWHMDPFLYDEAADRIEQLEAALELIVGGSTDKLQALQARSALDNIGANVNQQLLNAGQNAEKPR